MVRARIIPKEDIIMAINSCISSSNMIWDIVKKLETSIDVNTVQKLYDELKSFNAVSKILNCDRSTVRKFMHDNNLIYKSFPNMNRK